MNLVFASGFLVPQRFLPLPILGTGDYFKGVKELFERGGKYFGRHNAIFPHVPPTGTSASRAKKLAAGIPDDFAQAGFHIIAHSMAGLDSRVLISNNPNALSERIKSLTTICTPHLGTEVADLLIGQRPQDEREFLASITPEFVRSITEMIGAALGAGGFLAHLADAFALPALPAGGIFRNVFDVIRFLGIDQGALADLTTQGAPNLPDTSQEKPKRFPISYFSYAAVGRPPVDFDGIKKQTCLLLMPFHMYLKKVTGEENDGLVPLRSTTRFGEFLGKWECDHADAVGYNLDNPLQPVVPHLAHYDDIIGDLDRLFPD
jgi:triacylglycerol lipase